MVGLGCLIFAPLASRFCSLAFSFATRESLASEERWRARATSSRQALASLSTRVGRALSRSKLTEQRLDAMGAGGGGGGGGAITLTLVVDEAVLRLLSPTLRGIAGFDRRRIRRAADGRRLEGIDRELPSAVGRLAGLCALGHMTGDGIGSGSRGRRGYVSRARCPRDCAAGGRPAVGCRLLRVEVQGCSGHRDRVAWVTARGSDGAA